MTERVQSAPGASNPKMETDLSPRKTMLVVVIVVGCFAVLWPKVFYPMLVGSANQHIKPSAIDKTTGCCDVISETDINTIRILSELCGTIIRTDEGPLSGKEIVRRCRQEVLETCGIDISLVLQEQVRLGQSVKQILDEIRSLNGSLCLKYNFGVAPWKLGVPHAIKIASDTSNIRQERPMHLRSELVHPAFRERGRAIPQPQPSVAAKPPPRIVEGRPGPLPGMRPTIGGAGHVVPPSKQGTSSMSIIMPIYTIGIVVFFTYTLMKILFKKQPEGVGGSLYPPITPDPHFRKEVFDYDPSRSGPRLSRENASSKLVVNAMSALLDEVDQEIEARRKNSEVDKQDLVNGTPLSNGDAVKPQDEEKPTVKVLGMEMTASCEGGKKWARPESPVVPTPSPHIEPSPPPQEIYLEGALPAQSQLLVSESAIEPQQLTSEDPAVVLSGKMTLSVISLDSENGAPPPEPEKSVRFSPIENNFAENNNISEKTVTFFDNKFELEEKISEDLSRLEREADAQMSGLEKDIQVFLDKMKTDNEEITITVQNDQCNNLEVASLEKEVEDLIQTAIDNVQERAPQIEIKEDITKEIEKLIQEVEDIPVLTSAKETSKEIDADDELGSEEEVVEEIEEIIVYEEESDEEEIEIEIEEESEEEIPIVTTESSHKVNGDTNEDEESISNEDVSECSSLDLDEDIKVINHANNSDS